MLSTTTTTQLNSSATAEFAGLVVLTAAVTPNTNGVGTPTGNVKFYEATNSDTGDPLLGTATLGSNGQATFALSASTLPPGSYQLYAVYQGSSQFLGSTSRTVNQVIFGAPTFTTSSSAIQAGQAVTFTLSMPSSDNPRPTGTVTFYDQYAGNAPAALGSALTLVNGAASLTTSSLGPGNHWITAAYGGNSSYPAATFGPLKESVGNVASSVAVTFTAPSPYAGMPVTLSAAVTPGNSALGPASGHVVFYNAPTGDSGPVQISPAVSLDANGNATFATTALPAGYDYIYAVYADDVKQLLNGSTSAQAGHSFLSPPKPTVTSSVSTSVPGQPVTFTATMPGTSNGLPTGTVTFYQNYGGQNQAALGAAATLASGVASITTSSLGLGNDAITAVYSGDGVIFPAAASSVLTFPVTSVPHPVVTSSSNPAIPGQAVTLTATLYSVSSVTPTGTVTFYQNYGGQNQTA
ncbi:MAG TPA: Ig-like domain-containing protein, partial [Pirellulales bacterium]|nr:Ig-like domain-containing protein [Pirellulales bacterium]